MTEFTVQGDQNYAPLVVDLGQAEIFPLEGRDRVLGLKAFGMNAIVGKSWVQALLATEERVVMIPAGAQVSVGFANANNLHRHEHLNADPTKKGYLEDNRRVKAVRMGGHPSDALVVDAEAFAYLTPSAATAANLLPHGFAFDTVDGVTFSEKYIKPSTGTGQSMRVRQGAAKVRVTSESFPEHFDTKNLFRDDPFRPEDHVFVTQKLHGTSVRLGRVPVRHDLTWLERLARRFGADVREHDFQVVVGSRRVTKSINGKVEDGKEHWYDAGDIWTKATEWMHDRIPEGFLVYAEVIGWSPDGAPIQPGYTYNLPVGQSAVYVYRVAVLAESGDVVDLPWRAVQKFAEARGWHVVPELAQQSGVDLEPWISSLFLDKRLSELGDAVYDFGGPSHEERRYPQAVPLSDPKTVDEGVVVRYDGGLQPTVRKAKSPVFLGHESKVMDDGLTDTEEEQA